MPLTQTDINITIRQYVVGEIVRGFNYSDDLNNHKSVLLYLMRLLDNELEEINITPGIGYIKEIIEDVFNNPLSLFQGKRHIKLNDKEIIHTQLKKIILNEIKSHVHDSDKPEILTDGWIEQIDLKLQQELLQAELNNTKKLKTDIQGNLEIIQNFTKKFGNGNGPVAENFTKLMRLTAVIFFVNMIQKGLAIISYLLENERNEQPDSGSSSLLFYLDYIFSLLTLTTAATTGFYAYRLLKILNNQISFSQARNILTILLNKEPDLPLDAMGLINLANSELQSLNTKISELENQIKLTDIGAQKEQVRDRSNYNPQFWLSEKDPPAEANDPKGEQCQGELQLNKISVTKKMQ